MIRGIFWLCLSSCIQTYAHALETATATGQVRHAGEGIAGIFITAQNAVSKIETTVFTDADGRFALRNLALGNFRLSAHHARYTRAETELTLAQEGAVVNFDLELASMPMSQASTAAWFAHVPDSPRKREFILNCASCHEVAGSRIMKDGVLRDRAKWLEAFQLMKAIDAYAIIPQDFNFDEYATWLADNFSADKVATLTPPAVAGPAVRDAHVTITEYPVPIASELPHDLVLGPDHRVWITAFWNNAMWAMDPATGAFETYNVNDTPETVAQVRALEFNREGKLWVVNGGTSSVVKLDPVTREFQTIKVDMYPHDIVLDSTGDVWVNDYFAKKEQIAHVAAKTGKVTHYPLPSANLPASAGVPLPYGLQIDAQDRLWSTQLAANTLARFDIKTRESKLYTLPNDNSGPRRTAVGLDGKIWIPEFNTGRLTSFDPTTEQFDSFDTGSSAAGVYDVAVDPRTGDVWLGASLASELIHFDIKTQVFTHYPLPTEPAYMRHLAIDPENGDVWTAYSSLPTVVPKVVRLRREDPHPAPLPRAGEGERRNLSRKAGEGDDIAPASGEECLNCSFESRARF